MKERIIQVETGEKIIVILPSGERTVIFGPQPELQLPQGKINTSNIQAQDAFECVDDISDFM